MNAEAALEVAGDGRATRIGVPKADSRVGGGPREAGEGIGEGGAAAAVTAPEVVVDDAAEVGVVTALEVVEEEAEEGVERCAPDLSGELCACA
jgi:hypothetical protein